MKVRQVIYRLFVLCNDADGINAVHSPFGHYSVTTTETAHHGSGSNLCSNLSHLTHKYPRKEKGYRKGEVVLPSDNILSSDAAAGGFRLSCNHQHPDNLNCSQFSRYSVNYYCYTRRHSGCRHAARKTRRET